MQPIHRPREQRNGPEAGDEFPAEHVLGLAAHTTAPLDGVDGYAGRE